MTAFKRYMAAGACALAMLLPAATWPIAGHAASSTPQGARAIILPIKRTILPVRHIIVPLRARITVTRRQSKALQQAMTALKAQQLDSKTLKLEMAADVLFAFDSAAIRPAAARALSQAALIIRQRHATRVRVEGHTDAKGSDAYNLRLSRRRAAAVRDWLVRQQELPARLFTIRGWGESRPVAPNTHPDGSDNPEGRQRNRRVEIFVITR